MKLRIKKKPGADFRPATGLDGGKEKLKASRDSKDNAAATTFSTFCRCQIRIDISQAEVEAVSGIECAYAPIQIIWFSECKIGRAHV